MGKPRSAGLRSVLNRVFKTALRNNSGNVVLIIARAKVVQHLLGVGLRLCVLQLHAALMIVCQPCAPLRLRVLRIVLQPHVLQQVVFQVCEVLQLYEVQPLEALLLRCLALT